MYKTINRQRFNSLLLFVFEVLSLIAILTCEYFLPQFEYYFEIVISASIVFIILDVIIFWNFFKTVAKNRNKSDLLAASVIGNDVQEAYNFGKIGLIVTDESNNIIWTNEFFSDRKIDIVDTKIYDFKPALKDMPNMEEDKTVKIVHDNHSYEVKLIHDANLYIFKDVTDYESLFNYSKEQSPFVGQILIDNYADVATNYDENKLNDLLMTARKIMIDYCKKYDVLLRRFRTDAYLMIGNFSSYQQMLNDSFSIINDIRNIGDGDDSITISIGIGLGFPDIIKLHDMSSNAIDVALSRGGDQAVLAPYGDNMIFIGGKTEARAQRNRVKVRVLSQSLMTLISNADKILVMNHKGSDMDALGSALGLYAMATSVKKECKIVYDDKLTENKTRRAFKSLFSRTEISDMTISIKDSLEYITDESLVILTDVHRPSLVTAPETLQEATKVAIVDHHRRGEEFIESPVFMYIEPSASSASELVAEMARYNKVHVDLSPEIATMMQAGIFLDTNYYRTKTDIRTFDASMILKEYGSDSFKADDFLKEDFEEYSLKTKIMANTETPYYGIVISMADPADIIDPTALARVANESTQIKGINACFVIGRTAEKEVRISARSDGTVNVQLLVEKVGGGGHFTAAAAQFNDQTIDEVKNQIKKVLDNYLSEARVDEKK